MSRVIYQRILGPTAHSNDGTVILCMLERSSTSQLPHFVYHDWFAPLTSGFGESIGFGGLVAYWSVHGHLASLELVWLMGRASGSATLACVEIGNEHHER